MVARYGGEEMAVVLPDTDLRVAVEVADRIRRSIAETVVPFEEKELKVTVSMGVASFGAHASDPKALVKAADAALYQSKDAGRNRVTAADDVAVARA